VSSRLEVSIVPPLCPLACSAYDFSHSASLIERAEASTRAWLKGGGLDNREVPGEMRTHTH